jgi:hypothetical protein
LAAAGAQLGWPVLITEEGNIGGLHMNRRPVVVGTVAALVLALLAAVYWWPGKPEPTSQEAAAWSRRETTAPLSQAARVATDGSSPGTSTGSSSVVKSPTDGAGVRPPQFVVVSFDGAADVDLWRHWRAVGQQTGARFTFFYSGVYFLTRNNRFHYRPPQRAPGTSDIGFLPVPRQADPERYLSEILTQLNEGYADGHEIASHFNGHFCGKRGVDSWSADDWRLEIDGFRDLLVGASRNNSLDPPVALKFGPEQIVGVRTPCLEGNLDILYPVLRGRQFRYDASQTAREGEWPRRQDGIWSFPLASIPLVGTRLRVLSMDYAFYANQTDAEDAPPEQARAIEEQTYASLLGYFERSYLGNRALLSIGNHFDTWNHGAYVRAVTRLVRDVCTKPEVRCTTFSVLADWLDTQTPAQIASYQQGAFPALGNPLAEALPSAGGPPIAAPALEGSGPAEAARRYYELIASHRYGEAYELMSKQLRSGATRSTYEAWFANKLAFRLKSVERVDSRGNQSTVTVVVFSSDLIADRRVDRDYLETWHLILEEGGWKLDHVDTTPL